MSAATARLIDFARAAHALPPAVIADTRRLVRDTLAVGCAGASAPGADGVLAAARRMGEGPEVPLLGTAGRLPAPAAAFVNGFRIHALEWDAVHEPAVVHAMSVVTAAVHAVAHRAGGVEPQAALQAVAVGVEIASLLGQAATTPLSFFRPATAGVMGASVAAARLVGADPAAALGFALAQAAGTMQAHVEGSVALAVQVGLAARAAVTAADLAAAGLSGPRDMIEGPFGYLKLFDRGELAPQVEALGQRWRISEVSVKPWPCGRASHGVLGALAQHPGARRIEAQVPPLVHRLVGRAWSEDMTPAWARLCLPFLVACFRADGHVDPRRFKPRNFADPALMALAEGFSLSVDSNPDPNALGPQTIRLDGEAVILDALPGSPAAPLSPEAQAAKEALALSLAPEPAPFDPDALIEGRTA
ncbi:MAG: MmgE/PrpD family protein [Sphingomonadaceae bacterium]